MDAHDDHEGRLLGSTGVERRVQGLRNGPEQMLSLVGTALKERQGKLPEFDLDALGPLMNIQRQLAPQQALLTEQAQQWMTWLSELGELAMAVPPEMLERIQHQKLVERVLEGGPGLLESLMQQGVLRRLVSRAPLLRYLLDQQVLLQLLDTGLLQRMLQVKLLPKLIDTNILAELAENGVLMELVRRPKLLAKLIDGGVLDRLIETRVMAQLLQRSSSPA
eukprot:gene12837-15171_t